MSRTCQYETNGFCGMPQKEVEELQAKNEKLRTAVNQAIIELQEAELGEGYELNLRNLASRLEQALEEVKP